MQRLGESNFKYVQENEQESNNDQEELNREKNEERQEEDEQLNNISEDEVEESLDSVDIRSIIDEEIEDDYEEENDKTNVFRHDSEINVPVQKDNIKVLRQGNLNRFIAKR